ncbi:hypothetical protein HY213_02280 [Candidatus Peregrinibacteria bacterium]|nr:hypothetical protein [Candidatus Peregrinibacteria bacterium]
MAVTIDIPLPSELIRSIKRKAKKANITLNAYLLRIVARRAHIKIPKKYLNERPS